MVTFSSQWPDNQPKFEYHPRSILNLRTAVHFHGVMILIAMKKNPFNAYLTTGIPGGVLRAKQIEGLALLQSYGLIKVMGVSGWMLTSDGLHYATHYKEYWF